MVMTIHLPFTKKEAGGVELMLPLYAWESTKKDAVFYRHRVTEGYRQGYIADIVDLYKPDLRLKIWVFDKRVRKWRTPLHANFAVRNPLCKECGKWQKKFKEPHSDEELL